MRFVCDTGKTRPSTATSRPLSVCVVEHRPIPGVVQNLRKRYVYRYEDELRFGRPKSATTGTSRRMEHLVSTSIWTAPRFAGFDVPV